MTHNNPFLRFMAENDIAKSMQGYKNNQMDWQALFDMQRRNAHAWSQAGKVTMQNLQNITKKQQEMASQMVASNTSLAQKNMQNSTPDERMNANMEIIKSWTEQTAQNMNEMSGLLKASNEEAGKILKKRMSESIEELGNSMTKKKKADKAA